MSQLGAAKRMFVFLCVLLLVHENKQSEDQAPPIRAMRVSPPTPVSLGEASPPTAPGKGLGRSRWAHWAPLPGSLRCSRSHLFRKKQQDVPGPCHAQCLVPMLWVPRLGPRPPGPSEAPSFLSYDPRLAQTQPGPSFPSRSSRVCAPSSSPCGAHC